MSDGEDWNRKIIEEFLANEARWVDYSLASSLAPSYYGDQDRPGDPGSRISPRLGPLGRPVPQAFAVVLP